MHEVKLLLNINKILATGLHTRHAADKDMEFYSILLLQKSKLNMDVQKYNMVDTACSKTGSRHHVHCTQHRDTEIHHGGYSLLKDGLSTPCTLHTTQRYRNTPWWIQPAQRRALDTMYTAHNTEIQKYNMVDTACSKTGSRHHVHP